MNTLTLACIVSIALACIAGYVVMWALCRISARADEYTLHQGDDPKGWK